MDRSDLAGRVAAITGAGSGIGLATARRLAREGMALSLADVDGAALDAAAAGLIEAGATVHTAVLDVSDADAVEAWATTTVERLGGVHVIFNNAGVATGGLMWTQSAADWAWVVGVNLIGVANGVRSFVPRIIASGGGHVVNTASVAGLTSVPFMGPYTATKHAVVGLSEGLAIELSMTNPEVGVSVLCPAWVRTSINRSERNRPDRLGGSEGERLGPEAGSAAAALREMVDDWIAAGLDPDEVAEVVLEGIVTRRLHLLTHPGTDDEVVARARRIAAGEPPASPVF